MSIKRCLRTTVIGLVVAAMCAGTSARAGTVAYWRFEDGSAGNPVPHTIGAGQFEAAVPDVSGNGNSLSAWIAGGFAGYEYRADVPFNPVPNTGAVNNLSVKNTGGAPGMFTNSSVSNPSGVNIETWLPSSFTVETSWKPEAGGYRTVVGRDAKNVATINGDLAALYLQAQPDNTLAIKFADVAGVWHEAISAPGFVNGFDPGSDPNGANGTWYKIGAVYDGSDPANTTLKLYVNGSLVASSMTSTTDARLAIGSTSGGDWHAGGWSVGRGLYGGGHTDRGYGLIDEVRLSDMALQPGQLLQNVPEPSTAVLVLMAGLCGMGVLRRRG